MPVRPLAPGAATKSLGQGLLLQPGHDPLGLQESEDVGEIGNHHQYRGRHHRHRGDDHELRHEALPDTDGHPDAVNGGDDEETHHRQVGAVAKEHLGDPRRVPRGCELHAAGQNAQRLLHVTRRPGS